MIIYVDSKRRCLVCVFDRALVPPEADREADVDGPDIVPASWRDVEHLSRM